MRAMKRPDVKRLFKFPSRSRREVAADASEELLFHVDMRVEDLKQRGFTEAEARAHALREFGDLRSSLEEGVRHERRLERRHLVSRLLGDFRLDIRLGVRLIARGPALSAAAILTLAVAVAGNTAIFSVANALVFKPVPVAAPQDLARIRAGQSQMSWLNHQDLRDRTDVFAALVAHRRLRVGLSSLDALPVRLEGEQTSLNFFDTLRVSPTLGRNVRPGRASEGCGRPGQPHVASTLRGGSLDQGSSADPEWQSVRSHRGDARQFPRRRTGGFSH